MKYLILLVVCTLLSAVTFAGEPKKKDNDKEQFEISGYFVKNSNITYEVYEISCDSWDLIERGKGLKHYKLELEINKTYVITFWKEHKCKLLFVDVQRPSYIGIDVDFEYLQDATLKYTHDMEEYKVEAIKK